VLGDLAGLALSHPGLPDVIEQRGLAVVHVAHHRYHRRPGLEVRGPGRGRGRGQDLFLFKEFLHHLELILGAEQDRGFMIHGALRPSFRPSVLSLFSKTEALTPRRLASSCTTIISPI